MLSSIPVSVKNFKVPEDEEEAEASKSTKERSHIFLCWDGVCPNSLVSCSCERNMEWHSVSHWVVNISLFHENVDILDIVETDVSMFHDVMFILK